MRKNLEAQQKAMRERQKFARQIIEAQPEQDLAVRDFGPNADWCEMLGLYKQERIKQQRVRTTWKFGLIRRFLRWVW